MPSKVVVSSSARDALLRMQELDFVILSGVRMVKAGLSVVTAGLVAVQLHEKTWNAGGTSVDP
jgi:hypothetical protein